ncbi:hypothetical protein Pfo_014379 [Paulownia fortunei]|nr:hypothetical protein Pfo_014379 [Paulownia fortunei]
MGYYNEYSNINSVNHSGKFYYLKKVAQILLSVSVFSFLFSQSSLVPVLVHSYDYFVSKFSIKLFTYTTERNYIFLLCNGILVLIIQTSGLISKITPVQSSSKGGRIDDHHVVRVDESGFQEKKPKTVRKVEVFEEKGRENGGDDMEEGGVLAAEVDSKEDYQSSEIDEWEEEEEEEEEERIDEELSTDELNKKCEDFIKKVKQEIQGAWNNSSNR